MQNRIVKTWFSKIISTCSAKLYHVLLLACWWKCCSCISYKKLAQYICMMLAFDIWPCFPSHSGRPFRDAWCPTLSIMSSHVSGNLCIFGALWKISCWQLDLRHSARLWWMCPVLFSNTGIWTVPSRSHQSLTVWCLGRSKHLLDIDTGYMSKPFQKNSFHT